MSLSKYHTSYSDQLASFELLKGFTHDFMLCNQYPKVASDAKNIRVLFTAEAMQALHKEIFLGVFCRSLYAFITS